MEKEKKPPTLPNSKTGEMIILGAMLTAPRDVAIACDSLEELDFYYPEHAKVFSAIRVAHSRGMAVDLHVIAEALQGRTDLDDVGGVKYLSALINVAGTSADINAYVKEIIDLSTRRLLIIYSQIVEKKCFSNPSNVGDFLDEAQALFHQISKKNMGKDGRTLREVILGTRPKDAVPVLKAIEKSMQEFAEKGSQGVTGIPTGFADLDKVLNGFGISNLIILAARPAMGKTALALNIAESVAKSGKGVGIFSLEMGADELFHRIVSSASAVPSEKIKRGTFDDAEYERIVGAVSELDTCPLVIDHQAGLSVMDICARARRMRGMYNIELLVIDYMQLIAGSEKSENRQNEIADISRKLKTLARELDIPILCLSQLSRRVEERQGHRPLLSDLRDSGSVEQDSDVVLFLYRRDYYDRMDSPGKAEVIIAKNRHGKVGSVYLEYHKEFCKFV